MLRFLPSMLVAASIYFANTLREEPESWTDQLVHHTGYNAADLQACVGELRILLRDAPREMVLPLPLPASVSLFLCAYVWPRCTWSVWALRDHVRT